MDGIIVDETNADEIAIIENMQRENLKPLEEAEAVELLIKNHNYTQDDAAKILGKSRSSITELLGLLRLPETIRIECRTVDIPKSTLLAIARMDVEGQAAAFEAAKSGSMSVRTAKAIQKGSINPNAGEQVAQGMSPNADWIKGTVKGLYNFAKRAKAHEGEITPDDLKALREAKKQVDEAFKALITRPIASNDEALRAKPSTDDQ
jgi:ParB-like chromosome segregation protein Spo0J